MARHIKILKDGRRIAIRQRKKKPDRSTDHPKMALSRRGRLARISAADFRQGVEFLDEDL